MTTSTLSLPGRVRAGDPYPASDHNRVLEAIEQAAGISAAFPATVRRAGGGTSIAGDPRPAAMLQGRIAAVLVDNEPRLAVEAVNPSRVGYDVVVPGAVFGGPGTDGAKLLSLTPRYGRPVKDDEVKIWPADEGDLVVLHRFTVPDTATTQLHLQVLSERIAFGDCQQQGGA